MRSLRNILSVFYFRDDWGRKLSHVVAMDAICYSNPLDQYAAQHIGRELLKCYVSFHIPPSLKNNMYGVATGNWGCGAFNGDPELKGTN